MDNDCNGEAWSTERQNAKCGKRSECLTGFGLTLEFMFTLGFVDWVSRIRVRVPVWHSRLSTRSSLQSSEVSIPAPTQL